MPERIYTPHLKDCIVLFNGLVSHGMLDDLPEDLAAPVLRAELVEHLQLDQAVGKARSAETMSVEQRNSILEKAKPVFSRMTDLIDAHYPAGKPGRSSFFPTDITDPTMGDLLVSYGRGVQERGRPRLPDGWTPQSLIELGGDVNRALETRVDSGVQRKGKTNASAKLDRRTSSARARLRKLLGGILGKSNAKLLEFGMVPQPPARGGRRKAKAVAVAQAVAVAKDAALVVA